jgi:hypothetical protein
MLYVLSLLLQVFAQISKDKLLMTRQYISDKSLTVERRPGLLISEGSTCDEC